MIYYANKLCIHFHDSYSVMKLFLILIGQKVLFDQFSRTDDTATGLY